MLGKREEDTQQDIHRELINLKFCTGNVRPL